MTHKNINIIDPKIHTLFIELTNRCNFKCNFCPIETLKRPKGEMDLKTFKNIIDEVASFKITNRIAFHVMGEPLLSKILFDAIEYASSKGLKTALSTNGALLNKEAVQKLAKSGLNSCSISIETNDQDEHSTRGTSISFEKYYKTILDALLGLRKATSMELTLTMMNTVSRKYFTFDKKIGVNNKEKNFNSKLVSLICDIKKTFGEEIDPHAIHHKLKKIKTTKPQNIWVTPQIKIFIQLLTDWGNAFTSKKIHPAKIGFCGYTFDRIGILNDGSVTLCCVDYEGKTSIGNINEMPLSNILNSNQAINIRKNLNRNRIIHPYCRQCIGAPSKVKAVIKGLLSIYFFKINPHPLDVGDINLFNPN